MTELDLARVLAGRRVPKRKAARYRETVYAVLKDAILSGQLPAGQPLVEEQLATLLHVSRTPVREALIILEHEQIIGPRSGRGFFVRAITREEFIDMFEANEVVEPILARRAALYVTDAQADGLKVALGHGYTCAAAHDLAGFLRASRDIHRLIGAAAANRRLADFVLNNEERTDMYLLNSGTDIDPSNMQASLGEHAAIVEAVAQRDPQAAERLVIYHAQSLRARFADFFRSADSADGEL